MKKNLFCISSFIFLCAGLPGIVCAEGSEDAAVSQAPNEKPQQVEAKANGDKTDPLAKEVKRLKLEKSKLELEYKLESARHKKTLTKLQQEKDRLKLENELRAARQTQLLADLTASKSRLELENAISAQKQRQLLAELEAGLKDLSMRNSLQKEKYKQQELVFQFEMNKLKLELVRHKMERTKKLARLEELDLEIRERAKKEEWDAEVNTLQKYLKQPFVNGLLTITDRKISLDGPILRGTGDYITERIHYYNNKNADYPIFLVIGRSPGGSVMETAKIIKAMQASRVPVYVVVKSMAASAAAVITALAERSYAYPDAVLLHHQVSSVSYGNASEQEERLQILKEWSVRFMGPIAKKMGISLDEFVKQMYQHNSRGDWREFANMAAKLKWVDYIVEDIRDLSFTKRPAKTAAQDANALFAHQEKTDSQGRRYVKLPRLSPLDAYHIYNPDSYYQ